MTKHDTSKWEAAVAKKNLPCHCDQHLRDAGLPRPGTGKFGWKPSAVAVRGAKKRRTLSDQAAASAATVDGEMDELVRAAAELGINLDEVGAAA